MAPRMHSHSHPRARATRATTTTTRETMKRARGVARANANDGPFAVEEARGTLVTLATEIKREMTTTARDDERDDERGAARETRRAIEAIEKRDEEEEEEKTKWTTFGVRADDGSTARLSYAFSNVVDGASTTLALKMDAVDARGSDGNDLWLHWGVRAEDGGEWCSPQETLVRVPEGSRAPDGKSCESAFRASGGDAQTLELALETRGGDVRAVMCLPRTSDCRVWFKRDGGDISIEIPNGGLRGTSTKRERETRGAAAASPAPERRAEETREFAALNQWRGQEVKLQTHKGGNNERNVRWNTDNLAEVARRVVEGDRDSSSWRQKLQTVENIICENGADVDTLAYATVYLFWISVGAIACVEDGTHYRPNHHAGSAERMFGAIEAAERAANDIANGGDHHRARELRALIRRLHPRLPAFTAEFTQSVPLTRIRDIAHGKGDRDGKCRDVRQEIKHTIQNKLHRCAGPEDLVATEAMLAKLTAPGTDYPEEFVNEFKIFYRELKEFFNASSVTDRIDRIANENGAPGRAAESSKTFLAAKAKVDALPASDRIGDQVTMSASVECLLAIHVARVDIVTALESHGDLEHTDPATRQQWRLAELGMEDYAFVLLSRLLNTLGAETEPPRGDISASELKLTLEALALASRTMALSAGGDHELDAIAGEAEALARDGLPGGEEGGLRVQAVAERARRGAVDFCSLLESLFDGRASSLGHGLGIDDGSISVFTEGQIRASVVFQSAKLASLLLRVSRQITGAAGWDCVVQGDAVGALKCVDRLTPEDCAQFTEPVILVVASADGDEEVSTCGPHVRGVVLCHTLPHLSHLALRARQAQVPLIAIEDEKLVDHAKSLANASAVKLSAAASNITLEETTESAKASTAAVALGATAPEIHLNSDLSCGTSVLDLVELDRRGLEKSIAVAGTKSAMCARLSFIAEGSGDFSAPAGVVLPFGAMEFACAGIGKLEFLDSKLQELDDISNDPVRVRDTCEIIQTLVRSLRPSDETLQQIADKFDPGARVMVRSSANVEDLEGMSAAGLYDSIPNVDAYSKEALGHAISEVWASLFTTRAVASRAAAGVSHFEAHMCVLIQEMLSPEVSFVLHTKHPLTNDINSAYVEFALGLGETLASGAIRGTPCRVSVDKASRDVDVNAFASFGTALVRDDDSVNGMKSVAADYASHWLHNDADRRTDVARKLLDIGAALERELSPRDGETLAQDVEGCILPNGDVCIVQARPQP